MCASVLARVSAGQPSPRLAIASFHHRGWRVSAPNLLLLYFVYILTTAARCLTPRSSGAPTAGHQARSGGTQYIFASPGLASCRRSPLSSNVRPRRRDLPISKMQLLGFALARQQPRLIPRGAGLLSSVRRQAALAIPHRFIFGHLQRAKAACGTVRCACRARATFIASATNRAGVA